MAASIPRRVSTKGVLRVKLGLFISFICVSGVPLAASTPTRRFEAPITPVAVTEDARQTLWIAAHEGIFRFDGSHFLPLMTPGVDVSGPTHIGATADGAVWIGADQGLFRWKNGVMSLEVPGRVEALLITRAGHVLTAVAPNDEVYALMNASDQPRRWSKLGFGASTQFLQGRGGEICFAVSAYVYIWTDKDLEAAAGGRKGHGELPRFVPATGQLSAGAQSWTEVIVTPDHRLWARDGPDVVAVDSGRVTNRYPVPIQTFDRARPHFFVDSTGRLWLPGPHLRVVDKGIPRNPSISDPAIESVSVVYEDRQGTLWLGLPGKGLAALTAESSLQVWSDRDGIPGPVNDLSTYQRHGVLAATDSGAFAFGSKPERWLPIGNQPAESERSLATDHNLALLALPFRGGLWRSTSDFAPWQKLPLPSDVDPGSLRRFFHDAQGNLLIATTSEILLLGSGSITRLSMPGGGKVLDQAKVRQLVPPSNSTILDGSRPSDIAVGPDGQLWVGYEGGVARCQHDACVPAISPADGLLDPRVRSIAVTPTGDVWVAYRQAGGFSRFRRLSNQWTATHFTPQDNLGPPDTHFVRRDRRGWIWRGTTDGVYVSDGQHIEPEDWIKLTFGEAPNANHTSVGAFLEDKDGVWIGTQTGVVRIHPRADWFRPSSPRVSQVMWGGGQFPEFPRKLESGPQTLQVNVSWPRMPPFQSRLLRYRLLPISSAWRVSSNGVIQYGALAKGSYRLQLAAGEESTPVEYSFQIDGSGNGISILSFPTFSATGLGLIGLSAGAWWLKRRASPTTVELPNVGPLKIKTFAPEVHEVMHSVLDERYEVGEILARGGFATVLDGHDRHQDRCKCAVKIFRHEVQTEAWITRGFRQELAVLEQISHPNVVRVFGHGTTPNGAPYLVMEYVDGMTLRRWMSGAPVPPIRVAAFLRQIGSALSELHSREIFHRDLKPENIMVRRNPAPGQEFVLIDFSIAIVKDPDQSMHGISRAAGSLLYMAPENAIGYAVAATDIHALAKIAIELFTGRSFAELLPHASIDLPVQVRNVLAADSLLRLPETSVSLLAAAMEFHPSARPQDARAFAEQIASDLEALSNEDHASASPVPSPTTAAPSRLRPHESQRSRQD